MSTAVDDQWNRRSGSGWKIGEFVYPVEIQDLRGLSE